MLNTNDANLLQGGRALLYSVFKMSGRGITGIFLENSAHLCRIPDSGLVKVKREAEIDKVTMAMMVSMLQVEKEKVECRKQTDEGESCCVYRWFHWFSHKKLKIWFNKNKKLSSVSVWHPNQLIPIKPQSTFIANQTKETLREEQTLLKIF